MGSTQSSEVDDHTAPPVPARGHPVVYVWRNGNYELESFMPTMPRQSQGGPFGQNRVTIPPELKQTSLVQNPAHMHRDTLVLEDCGDGRHALAFTFDASAACEARLHLAVLEADGPLPQLLPNTDVDTTLQPQKFEAGMGQRFRSEPIDLSMLPRELLTFSKDNPRAFPIVAQLHVEAFTPPNASSAKLSDQFTYISLIAPEQKLVGSVNGEAQEKWGTEILVQKLRLGGQLFTLYDVFGMAPDSVLAPTKTDFSSTERTECIICLSEPRDTTVLPCRHLCFCGHCAKIIRLQCDKCPICRQKVSSLLQFDRGGEQKDSQSLWSTPSEGLDTVLPQKTAASTVG